MNLKKFARLGYAARGAIYIIVGYFAVLAAMDAGGSTIGSKGALQSTVDEPFGVLMLCALGGGLVCYALWRFVQSIVDTDDHGADPKGIAIRGGLFVSGITHSLLAIFAFMLVLGDSSQSGSGQTFSQWLLSQPYGSWLLGIAALTVCGAGMAHIWKGVSRKFEKRMKFTTRFKKLFSHICLFGLTARGVVFVIVSGLMLSAAISISPANSNNLEGALNWVQQLPFGAYLLSVIAFGLLAFGMYSSLEAKYRVIQ